MLNGSDPDAPGVKTQFPIFEDPDKYRSGSKDPAKTRRGQALAGVASRHKSIIDQLQPYQAGKGRRNHPLALLATLNDRDKHRVPHPGFGRLHEVGFHVNITGTTKYFGISFTYKPPGRALDEETQLGAFGVHEIFDALGTPRYPEVEVTPKFRLGLVFGEREVTPDDLTRIIEFVENDVIGRFVPAFE